MKVIRDMTVGERAYAQRYAVVFDERQRRWLDLKQQASPTPEDEFLVEIARTADAYIVDVSQVKRCIGFREYLENLEGVVCLDDLPPISIDAYMMQIDREWPLPSEYWEDAWQPLATR